MTDEEKPQREYASKGSYENFYIGNSTPLDTEFGDYFVGHTTPAGKLGAPTSAMTADQIREASKMLNTGMKIVEVGAVQADVFETIPKQHFKEMGRIAKLTGSKMTVHGPIVGVDMAGFTERGWQEEHRQEAERHIADTMEKTHQIDPTGNIPVTFHGGTSTIQGIRYLDQEERTRLLKEFPDTDAEIKKEIQSGKIRDSMTAINPETGELRQVTWEEKNWPEGKIIFDPKRRIRAINSTEWDNKKFQLSVLEEQKARLAQMIPAEEYGMIKERLAQKDYRNEKERIQYLNQIQQFEAPLRESNSQEYLSLSEMYNDVMDHGDDYSKGLLQKNTEKVILPIQKELREAEKRKDRGAVITAHHKLQSDETLRQLRGAIMQIPAPQKWKAADEFATEKVAQTAANAAFTSWKKFKGNSPTLALENYPGTVMSTGEDSARVVKRAREKFVELAKNQGMSAAQAKGTAAKLIGLTWDLGHINMLRKHGFSEKFVVEETKKAAPYVQKMHLTDNFGFSDSHLPPGMGNVPFKKALAEIEKAGRDVPHIVEAPGFAQHFKTNPHPYTLEALGSPLYTYMNEPYWNQVSMTQGNYFQGYGDFLPDFHFQSYGSPSFSALPIELGGQQGGDNRQSFSGRGME